MAKSIDNQPTSTLMTYQQMIGLANQQMDQFKEDIENIQKEGTISEAYVKETQAKIDQKIGKNNELLKVIEDELFKRVRRDNKGATTSEYMNILFRQFHEEKANYKKRHEKKKESKTIDLNVEEQKK